MVGADREENSWVLKCLNWLKRACFINSFYHRKPQNFLILFALLWFFYHFLLMSKIFCCFFIFCQVRGLQFIAVYCSLFSANKNTLREETFAGRNFRVFADFGLFRESFFRKIFQDLSSAKVYSREIFKISQPRNFFYEF